MKIYFTILLSFLLLPLVSFAAYNDVTLSGSTVIKVGGYNLVVSGTANLDSITVGSNTFTVIMSKGAQLVVTSADKLAFGVSPDQYYEQSFTCGSSNSTLTLGNAASNSIGIATINIAGTCAAPASTGSSGSNSGGMIIGGGGGGGGGYTAPAALPSTVQTPAAPTTPTTGKKLISVSPVFTKILNPGNISSDVKRLQQILNSDPNTQIAATGVGSPGKETNYFGPATKTALQKFQCKYNIVCSGTPSTTGYGNLGPKTRTKLQQIFQQK